MRDDDERELFSADRTILYTGHRPPAEDDLTWWFGAGIPHRPFEGRTVGVGGHVDGPETGSLRERCRETEGDRDEEF